MHGSGANPALLHLSPHSAHTHAHLCVLEACARRMSTVSGHIPARQNTRHSTWKECVLGEHRCGLGKVQVPDKQPHSAPVPEIPHLFYGSILLNRCGLDHKHHCDLLNRKYAQDCVLGFSFNQLLYSRLIGVLRRR